MGLLDFLKDTIGVDPGSQNLRIIKGGELVFNESSQISIDKTGTTVSGLGNAVTATDASIRPVDYVITDFQAFEMLFRGGIKKALNPRPVLPKSYIMYFSIPTSTKETEKRVYRDTAEHAGAIEVYMAQQGYCSAIGMNILFEKRNFILIDVSSSKIEMVVFANSHIISNGVVKLGTWKIYKLLRNHIRRKYKVELSGNEIEDVLTVLSKNGHKDEVRIHHTTIATKEIQDVLANLFNLVNDEFMETIERVSDHPDIEKAITNGIYFTGGGSLISFLTEQIKLDDRIKRSVSQNPLFDNINGLKQVMADTEKFKSFVMV